MTLGELITGLGYLTGIAVLIWAARERKLLTQGMLIVSLVATTAGILGAKLCEYISEGWPLKLPPASILDPENGGKALLGGLLIGWLAAVIAKKRMGIKRSTGDLFALALPAGEAVGRIGCFFNGCCYGTVYNGPLAVYQHGAWRQPAQFYSSAAALLTFVALLLLRNRMPKEGDLFKLYLVLFGVTRFGLEFIRERPLVLGDLSLMQIVCLELFAAGLVALLYPRLKKPTAGAA